MFKKLFQALVALLAMQSACWATTSNTWSGQDVDLYAGDFNGDGSTDLLYVARDGSGLSGVVLSDGTSLTIAGQTWASNYLGIPWSGNAYRIVVGDFNGDGRSDLFLEATSPGDSYVLLADSNGQFTSISQTIPNQMFGQVWSTTEHQALVGDFNGDGRADILLQPTLKGGNVAVFLSDSSGQFSAPSTQTWSDGFVGQNWSTQDANVLVGDFNGDGRADLLIQSWPTYLGTYNNVPSYQYTPQSYGAVVSAGGTTPFALAGLQTWDRTALGVDWSPLVSDLVVGDFDGDGRSDVLVRPVDASATDYLLTGRASGPILNGATAGTPTNVNLSATSVRLIVGRFAGAKQKSAQMVAQSILATGANYLVKWTANGFQGNVLSLLPGASATSTASATSGLAAQSALTAQASTAAVTAAATVTPTSAGRTAAQFSVSPTGAATYNIPIWTPPGVREIEPHLALHYTSGGPDGPMGPGWALSGLSAIARCGKTYASSGGSPAGVTLTVADDICIDGNRLRLVSGAAMTSGAVYQTELADFSRVTAYGIQGNGPQYFVVETKSGRYYEYGNSADSRIFSSGQTTPYAWGLSKVRDRSGNNMTISYAAGSAIAVAKIVYTATPSNGGGAPYEVDVNYVARAATSSISRYVAGGQVSLPNQIDSISVFASGAMVRKYQLGYQSSPTTGRQLLSSIQECGGASGTDCLRPTTLTYQSGAAGWSNTATTTSTSLFTGQYGFFPIDLNQDGIPDAVYGKLSGSSVVWYARLGTATGYGQEFATGITTTTYPILPASFNGSSTTQLLAVSGSNWYTYTYHYNAATGTSYFTSAPTSLTASATGSSVGTVDWDGDGLPDIVGYSNTTYSVWKNISSPNNTVDFATTPTVIYQDTSGQYSGLQTSGRTATDFNGDGRGDVLAVHGSCLAVRGGTCHYSAIALLSNGFGSAATAVTVDTSLYGLDDVAVGDINGDGCADVLTIYYSYTSACNGAFQKVSTGLISHPRSAPYTRVTAVDWDGDGLTDMLYQSAVSSSWELKRSNGVDLSATSLVLSIPYYSLTAYFPADQNADGQLDLMRVDSVNGYAIGYLPHNGINTPPDLMSSVSDGLGITFSPSYVAIDTSSIYTKGTAATYPELDFQGGMYVVNQFSASDGISGTYTKDFQYAGARFNVQGRGFEGFASTRAHDSRNSTYEYALYNQTFPLTGSVYSAYTTDGSTNLTRTDTSYTYTTLAGINCSGRCFVYASGSTTYNYEISGTKKGNSISNAVTANTYDAYGSPTDTKITVTDTDSMAPASPFLSKTWTTEIVNTITNDTGANWCLGRPSRSTTTKTVPNPAGGTYAATRTVDHAIDYVQCRATTETVEPLDAKLKVVTSFGFDSCGNTNSVSVVGLDPTGAAMAARTTLTDYGARCQFPEHVTNPLGQISSTTYRYDLGVPSSITDPNILAITWQYDNFGRKTQEVRPDGTFTNWVRSDCIASPCWGVSDLRFRLDEWLFDSAGQHVRNSSKFYDGLDRLRYDEYFRPTGVWTAKVILYDQLGRKNYEYLPYSSGSNGYHSYGYDIGNRPTVDTLYTSANASYRSVNINYFGQTVTVTDPNGNTITRVSDVDGNVRQVTDPSTNGTVAGTTSYTVDAFKNVVGIQDATGATSSFQYNVRGFKTQSTDADTGTWTFTPDSLNELWTQKDAKNQTTSFGYDPLGRMTSRLEPESTAATIWTYGTSAALHNIGKLYTVSKPDGYAEGYAYDSVGRPLTVTYTVDGSNYAVDYAYNVQGTVDTLTYPVSTSGYRFALKYVYDAKGYPSQVNDNAAGTVFWTLTSTNDSSLPTLETLGNGVQVASGYTPWTNEMISRSAGTGGSTTNLENLAYQWDLASNLQQRQDIRQSLTEQFTYDAKNRLKSSTLNGVSNLSMTYDAAGDVATKSDVSASAYVYGDAAHKHAVTTAGSWTMSYDADGNMISRAGGAITWYSYNLPNTIAYGGNTDQFFYNASHQRWKQIANYGGTVETTRYVGGILEVMTRGTVTEYRHQIPAGSGTAIYTRRSDGTSGTYYATSDHLGSSDLLLDSAGTVLARQSYTPFGARRGSTWQGVPTTADYAAFANSTRRGFTGHEMLDSVGLIHMNGRVYDPYLARFMSADTVIQSLGATESINPFSYVWNNPLRYVDPTGHDAFDTIFEAIMVIFLTFATYGIGTAYGLAGWEAAGLAGFVGGFAGAYIATGSGSAALSAGLVGALTAIAFYAVGTLGENAWSSPKMVLAHAAVGCLSGAASGGNCGRSALAAAVTEAATQSGFVEKPEDLGKWGTMRGAAEAGLVGGAASRLVGGSFSDGFSVAAAGYLFNDALHVDKGVIRGEITMKCNGVGTSQCDAAVAAANASNIMFSDGTGIQITYRRYNTSFWDMFSSPDIEVTVQPMPYNLDGQRENGYFNGGHTIFVDPTRVETNTIPHEIGHFFGLYPGSDHNPNMGSVMYGNSVADRPFTFDHSDVQQLLKKFAGGQ